MPGFPSPEPPLAEPLGMGGKPGTAISSSCRGRWARLCWAPGGWPSQQGGLIAEDTRDQGCGLSSFGVMCRKKAAFTTRNTAPE